MQTATLAEPCPSSQVREFPQHLREQLSLYFSPMRVEYIASVLTEAELAVIVDISDALIIARIKRMSNDRLDRFDSLYPIDKAARQLYHDIQLRWLHDVEYYLGTRLGRRPTEKELFCDFMNNHHGLRFRAYFSLKFPEKMAPCRKDRN